LTVVRVLYVAYHFPPTGGAGTQRTVRFVRFLPDHGLQPIIVTGPGPSGSRWEPEDQSLLAAIPPGITTLRAASRDPNESFANWWSQQILELGRQAASFGVIDVVVVTLSPYDGIRVPVVVDLRDPWALDEVTKYRTRWHRANAVRTMGRLLGLTALIIANTAEARTAIVKQFGSLDPAKVVVIPNGFVAEDFQRSYGAIDDGKFRIVHAGYLHTELAIANSRRRLAKKVFGGALWAIDLSTRSHIYLLQAVERLHATDPDLAATIEIVLVGVLTDADREVVAASSVANQVVTPGFMPHDRTIEYMMAADALFLPLHDIPRGCRSRIVPGKTYEYLAAGKPIIAAVPEGDVRDLINELDAGVVTEPSDVDGIARAIRDLARGVWSSPAPRHDAINRFESRQQARVLSSYLRRVVHGWR